MWGERGRFLHNRWSINCGVQSRRPPKERATRGFQVWGSRVWWLHLACASCIISLGANASNRHAEAAVIEVNYTVDVICSQFQPSSPWGAHLPLTEHLPNGVQGRFQQSLSLSLALNLASTTFCLREIFCRFVGEALGDETIPKLFHGLGPGY